MEDIQIWSIDGTQVAQLEPSSQLESELLLENILVSNPNLLMGDLTLVGRQTPTEGGPLDLLGVDGDGRLVVFELKRGILSRDAVAQVIDYASFLDNMELSDLADHISEESGEHGIDKIEDFQDFYSQRFGELESLKPLRMFLVGLGADDRTERMVRFLAKNSNMDISLLTFHGFDFGGKIILAKQVEVEVMDDPDSQATRRRQGRKERLASLNSLIERFDIRELFDGLKFMFQKEWPQAEQVAGTTSLSLRLPELADSGGQRRPYARIDATEGGVRIVFYRRSVELLRDEFKRLSEDGLLGRWMGDLDGDGYLEAQFSLTADKWDTHEETLTTLTREVHKAWENSGSGE